MVQVQKTIVAVDGVLPAFGMGEHAVLHSGLSAHWDLQCHDTEGQYSEEALCEQLLGVRN